MSTIRLEAEARAMTGKGASRRLRRLEDKLPAIVYGGDKAAETIYLSHNKVRQALQQEAIYASMLDLAVDGKVQHVILKDLQRHPYKPVILHMDFQRVSSSDVLVKSIPLHFMNEATAKGVKAGGQIQHTMTQVEVRCKVSHLPAFIEVDVAPLELEGVLHLSDLKLPKGVELTVDATDSAHNAPVVSIHTPKVNVVEDDKPEAPAEPEATEEGKPE